MKMIALFSVILFLFNFTISGCTTFQTSPVSFKIPAQYPNHLVVEGVSIAIEVINNPEESIRQFSVDLREADLLPVKLIAKNDSRHEIEIDSSQVFGITSDGTMYNVYLLSQSSERVRKSQIGKSMATGAVVGALVGAAAGAAIGGAAGGDSRGVGAGAGIGGTVGALSGGQAGVDTISEQIRRELRPLDWGDRLIYPGYLVHGFLFFKNLPYERIQLNIFDINENKMKPVEIKLH